MLTGSITEFAGEAVGEIGEGGVVLGRQQHREGVGRDGAAPDVERAGVVHVAGESTTDLDRAHPAAEHAGEDPLDGVLQAALEPLQSHADTLPTAQAPPVAAAGR